MAKSILDKTDGDHKFVSPSAATDHGHKTPSTGFTWKEGLALASTVLTLRKMPRVLLIGALGVGLVAGYNMLKAKKAQA